MADVDAAPDRTRVLLVRFVALGIVVALAFVLGQILHLHGHAQGDDFALYLRQARSVFQGDIARVVSDNRFAVLNSDSAFSPIAYPWGWPLVLSPFVHFWGFDYDRLKVVVVGLFCVWLVLFHGIVRRRVGRWIALAATAVMATAPMYLQHTNELISEIPHMAALGLVFWWYDRVRRDSPLTRAPIGRLVGLGLCMTAAFNVRRESIVLFAVFLAVQGVEVLGDAWGARTERVRAWPRSIAGSIAGSLRSRWRAILTPHLAFAVSALVFQFLLPSDLLPNDGKEESDLLKRLGDYPKIFTRQIGLGAHPALGVAVLIAAAIGVVLGVRRRPALDGPIVVYGLLTAYAIGRHFRTIERYWFQITPWVLYFAVVMLAEVCRLLVRHRERIVAAVAVLPLVYLLVVRAAVVPGVVADARDFAREGKVLIGPGSPYVVPVYEAVVEHTPPTSVVVFFRARTMTLLTDRLSFQTTSIDKMMARGDFWAQRKGSKYWQPDVTTLDASELGLEEVWSDSRWILWKIPEPSAATLGND